MTAHGPDAATFERASAAELKPHKIDDTLAFMFETRFRRSARPVSRSKPRPCSATTMPCWQGLPKLFKG